YVRFTPKADMCGATKDVRYGSKPDICNANRHVRFTPNSEQTSARLDRNADQRECGENNSVHSSSP
ncbi:MAG: hypothetical protein WB839_20635, partial [Pseudolabrys sp.]